MAGVSDLFLNAGLGLINSRLAHRSMNSDKEKFSALAAASIKLLAVGVNFMLQLCLTLSYIICGKLRN
jgi:hypothetical protein